MTKAVFTTKMLPTYADLPERQYHFPTQTYVNQISPAVGDWILYYEPRRSSGDVMSRGGRQAYFATAFVEEIVPDPDRPDHSYAIVSNYLPFSSPVPFKVGDTYFEKALRKPDGSTNKGAFGRAVRLISDDEYRLILATGFATVLASPEVPTVDVAAAPQGLVAINDDPEPTEQERKIEEKLVSRPFRDRAFSAAVKSAYEHTCAVTGFKILSKVGNSEVQAAHIRPVGHRGPDSVRNGIALTGTVHWMFDSGLIAISDRYELLVAKNRLTDAVKAILPPDRRLILPSDPEMRPHPQFIEYHRENVFVDRL